MTVVVVVVLGAVVVVVAGAVVVVTSLVGDTPLSVVVVLPETLVAWAKAEFTPAIENELTTGTATAPVMAARWMKRRRSKPGAFVSSEGWDSSMD